MATLGGVSKLVYYPRNLTNSGSGSGAQFKVLVDPELKQYSIKNISSGDPTEGTANFAGNGVVHAGKKSGTAEFSAMGKFVPNMSGNQGTISGMGNALVKFSDGSITSMLGSFGGKGTLVKGFFKGKVEFSGTTSFGDPCTGTGIVEGSTTAKESVIYGTGTGYKKKDIILISGTSLGGLSDDNDLVVTVADVDNRGGIVGAIVSGECKITYNNVKGVGDRSGSDAAYEITKTKDSYSIRVMSGGKNYELEEVITISGSYLGGESPSNDLKFTVIQIDDIGGIVSVSTSDEDLAIKIESEIGLSVIGAVVVDSGVGYLSVPDGSTGGSGTVFSTPEQTILFNEDNGYDVYNPNTTIDVKMGDLLGIPSGSIIELYDEDGNVTQVIQGEGQLEMKKVTAYSSFTTPVYVQPENQQIYPANQEGAYPVVLYIKDVAILNGGANYDEDDKIVIVPDRGAVLTPKYGSFGKLEKVEIENGGLGFDEIPNIFIRSETGINALIVPIFGVIRIGDLTEDQDIVPPGTPMVNVVDCVGRVD